MYSIPAETIDAARRIQQKCLKWEADNLSKDQLGSTRLDSIVKIVIVLKRNS